VGVRVLFAKIRYKNKSNEPMKLIKELILCVKDKELIPTALKVSLIVGSILFTINHGAVLLKGKMTKDRWIAGILTYIVPYGVSLHGQCVNRNREKSS